MDTQVGQRVKDLLKEIGNVVSEQALSDLEHQAFGRKQGIMTVAMKELRDLPESERRSRATQLNNWKQEITAALEEKKSALQSGDGAHDAVDVTLNLPPKHRGHLHLIPEFIREVEDVFGRMGFDSYTSQEIEDEEHNFDLLNFPKDHAARDAQDVFFIDDDAPADNRTLLRAHTSPGQIRYMRERTPPFRAIFPGKVYRKDADATHSPMFHQFEGLMI